MGDNQYSSAPKAPPGVSIEANGIMGAVPLM